MSEDAVPGESVGVVLTLGELELLHAWGMNALADMRGGRGRIPGLGDSTGALLGKIRAAMEEVRGTREMLEDAERRRRRENSRGFYWDGKDGK